MKTRQDIKDQLDAILKTYIHQINTEQLLDELTHLFDLTGDYPLETLDDIDPVVFWEIIADHTRPSA